MRLEQLTFIRFIAAITVVIHHFGLSSFPFKNQILNKIFKQGDLGVSFFFFLSSNPFDAESSYLFKYLKIEIAIQNHDNTHLIAAVISIVLTFLGVGFAFMKYKGKSILMYESKGFWHELLFMNFYIH